MDLNPELPDSRGSKPNQRVGEETGPLKAHRFANCNRMGLLEVCVTCEGDGECVGCDGSGIVTIRRDNAGAPLHRRCTRCDGDGLCNVCGGEGEL